MRAHAFLPAMILLAGVALPAGAADITQQVRAEIQRVHDQVSGSAPDTRLKDIRSSIEASLKAASEDLASGLLYSSLEKLAQASDLAGGMRAIAKEAEVAKSGMPAFEAERKKASERVSQIGRVPEGTPAAIQALAETARVKAAALVDGARGFATALHPQDGLFYLGEAEALAEMAAFCARIGESNSAEPAAIRSLAPELVRLQDKTDAAFVPPQSIEQHSTFIELNSAIKLARELNEANLYAGALYQYLDAVRQFGILTERVPGPAARDALRDALTAERRKLAGSKRDDSIARAWLERAQSAVAHAPNDDAWKSAALVLGQVLPAYYAALGAPPAFEQRTGKAVEVTLVRWPYT